MIRTIKRVLVIGVREGLNDLPRRGRPNTISPEAKTWIVSLLCQKPFDFGYPHELWTQRLLQQYIREHAVEEGFPEVARISQGTISKIANASAIKPHKIKSYVQKQDPALHEKVVVVLHTYQEANILKILETEGKKSDTFILSFDEKSSIQVLDTTYPDLMPVPGKFSSIRRDYEYMRNGTVCLQAAIDLVTGCVHYWIIIETFFSKTTRTVLRGIRAKSREEIAYRISQYIDALNRRQWYSSGHTRWMQIRPGWRWYREVN